MQKKCWIRTPGRWRTGMLVAALAVFVPAECLPPTPWRAKAMDPAVPSTAGREVPPRRETETVGLKDLFDFNGQARFEVKYYNSIRYDYRKHTMVKSIFLNRFTKELIFKLDLLDRYLFRTQEDWFPLLLSDRLHLRRQLNELLIHKLHGYGRHKLAVNLQELKTAREAILRHLQDYLFINNKLYMKKNFVYGTPSTLERGSFLPKPEIEERFYRTWSRVFEDTYKEKPPVAADISGVMINSLCANMLRAFNYNQDQDHNLVVDYMFLLFDSTDFTALSNLEPPQQEALREGRRALQKLLSLPFITPAQEELRTEFLRIARQAHGQRKIRYAPPDGVPDLTTIDSVFFLEMNRAIQRAKEALPALFPQDAAFLPRVEGVPAATSARQGHPRGGELHWRDQAELAWQEISQRLEEVRRRENVKPGLAEVRNDLLTMRQNTTPSKRSVAAFANELLGDIDQLIQENEGQRMREGLTRVIANLRAQPDADQRPLGSVSRAAGGASPNPASSELPRASHEAGPSRIPAP